MFKAMKNMGLRGHEQVGSEGRKAGEKANFDFNSRHLSHPANRWDHGGLALETLAETFDIPERSGSGSAARGGTHPRSWKASQITAANKAQQQASSRLHRAHSQNRKRSCSSSSKNRARLRLRAVGLSHILVGRVFFGRHQEKRARPSNGAHPGRSADQLPRRQVPATQGQPYVALHRACRSHVGALSLQRRGWGQGQRLPRGHGRSGRGRGGLGSGCGKDGCQAGARHVRQASD